MKKLIAIFGMIFVLLESCQSPEERKKNLEKNLEENTLNISILDLKQVVIGESYPEFYMIDTHRNSYEISSDDFVRLQVNDSVQIYNGSIYADILKIYTKKNKL